jgi:hypothetical protein
MNRESPEPAHGHSLSPVRDEGASPSPPGARSPERFDHAHRASLHGVPYGVYVIPPDARGDGDDKAARRHLLAVEPSDVRVGTAIYGTKSGEPARRDAPCRSVRPRYGRDGNGLEFDTNFYPTVLTYVYPAELGEMRGRLTNAEADPVRREVRRAFGIGQGRRGDAGVPAESWRGRIVEFPGEIIQRHHLQFGVVLTCHEHSRHRYDQLVVPLAQSDPAIDDPEQDVVSDDPACAALLGSSGAAVWVVPMVFTVHQKRQPLLATGRVTEGDLRRIEEVLVSRFGL